MESAGRYNGREGWSQQVDIEGGKDDGVSR